MTLSDGDKAWIGLLAYVVAYDAFAKLRRTDTLSRSFDRAMEDPVRGQLTLFVWVIITVHLFSGLIRRLLEAQHVQPAPQTTNPTATRRTPRTLP